MGKSARLSFQGHNFSLLIYFAYPDTPVLLKNHDFQKLLVLSITHKALKNSPFSKMLFLSIEILSPTPSPKNNSTACLRVQQAVRIKTAKLIQKIARSIPNCFYLKEGINTWLIN